MIVFRTASAMMALALAWGVPAAAGFNLFSNSWGDVIVATDTTPEGRKLEPPSPSEPVYYLGRSLGAKLGSLRGDTLPDEEEMTRFVAKVLAKQGYLGATPGVHEPTLYLVVQWGYLQPSSGDLLWFLGYNPEQDIAAPSFPGMLGPEVWRRGFRSRTIEAILDGASTSNYGIIVTAFEYESADTPEPIVYWQTRIALTANGKSMAAALPAMLVAAGPDIGRAADSPVLRDANEARRGVVEMGDLEVLEFEPGGESTSAPGRNTEIREVR